MAKTIGYIFLSLVLIAAVGCLGILIYGGCAGLNFVEAFQKIFGITKKAAEVAETTGALVAQIKVL